MAWHSGAAPDRQTRVMEVLLVDPRRRRLVATAPAAGRAGAGRRAGRHAARRGLRSRASPGSTRSCRRAATSRRPRRLIDEEIARLAKDGPTPAELAKARNQALAGFWRGLETISGKAQALGTYEVFHGDYRKLFDAPAVYEGITAEDVRQAAAHGAARGEPHGRRARAEVRTRPPEHGRRRTREVRDERARSGVASLVASLAAVLGAAIGVGGNGHAGRREAAGLRARDARQRRAGRADAEARHAAGGDERRGARRRARRRRRAARARRRCSPNWCRRAPARAMRRSSPRRSRAPAASCPCRRGAESLVARRELPRARRRADDRTGERRAAAAAARRRGVRQGARAARSSPSPPPRTPIRARWSAPMATPGCSATTRTAVRSAATRSRSPP